MQQQQPTCSQCQGCNIETDDTEAMSFCFDCGYVTSTAELRSVLPACIEQIGVFVNEDDDGTHAAEATLGRPATMSSAHMKVARPISLTFLNTTAGQLLLPESVRLDAQGLLQGMATSFRGSQSCLAAAVILVAARRAQLPVHLFAIADAAQIPSGRIWRLVQLTLRHMHLVLPRLPQKTSLKHAIDSICAKNRQEEVGKLAEELLLLAVNDDQLRMAPLHCCAAILATTLRHLQLPTDKVGAAFGCQPKGLANNVLKIRVALVAAASSLPFAEELTPATVLTYLPTILRFSKITRGWSSSAGSEPAVKATPVTPPKNADCIHKAADASTKRDCHETLLVSGIQKKNRLHS